VPLVGVTTPRVPRLRIGGPSSLLDLKIHSGKGWCCVKAHPRTALGPPRAESGTSSAILLYQRGVGEAPQVGDGPQQTLGCLQGKDPGFLRKSQSHPKPQSHPNLSIPISSKTTSQRIKKKKRKRKKWIPPTAVVPPHLKLIQ